MPNSDLALEVRPQPNSAVPRILPYPPQKQLFRCNAHSRGSKMAFLGKSDIEMNQASFGKAIPVLASLDMARTLNFYREVLGFSTQHFEGFSYGMAVRGDTEIHFWACNDQHIAENTSCYIRVEDIAAVHRELGLKLPSLQAVVRTAWGMDELYVIDPDGNLIKFGQESSAQ